MTNNNNKSNLKRRKVRFIQKAISKILKYSSDENRNLPIQAEARVYL